MPRVPHRITNFENRALALHSRVEWTGEPAGACDGGEGHAVGPKVDAGLGYQMLRSFEKRPEHLQALDRVKAWTRARFKLPEDVPILVSEVACGLPGCPPLETVIAFWTQSDSRHHFKVFKRVEEVVPDDLPPTWMKNALIAFDGDGLECC